MKFNRSNLVSLFILLSAFVSISYADLSGSEFMDLIKESEIIVIAKAGKPTYDEACSKLVVVELLKGVEQSPAIEIKWSPEFHDQKITKQGTYLLFLKKHDGENYSGTHYGRSYWSLNATSGKKETCSLFTPYTYPINTVKIKNDYLTTSGKKNNSTQVICLEQVKQAIIDFL